MKTKIGLVQINNSFVNACYFPYSVGLLQTYFQKHSEASKEFEFLLPLYLRIPVSQATAYFQEVSILGISLYVWNVSYSLAIAKQLKKINPEILIVAGGPHVPDLSENFLRINSFIDVACHGEGEKAFLQIVENYHTRNWENIPSISYLKHRDFIKQQKIERISDLSSVYSPYVENVFDELVHMNTRHKWIGLLETNRGCPFSCSYCEWGASTYRKLNVFDISKIKQEIEWFAKNKIEFIFCCDANYGILERDIDITQYVIDSNQKWEYPIAFSVQNTKNSTDRSYLIQHMLSNAGLNKGVNLALQTVDKETLKNIRRHNISLNVFHNLQKKFNKDQIPTFTDMILALPGETYESFIHGICKIIQNGQHNKIQFINLSILPNSEMGNIEYQKKYDLDIIQTKIVNIHGVDDNQGNTDEFQEIVIATKTMSRNDWIKSRVISWMISFLYFDKIFQLPIIIAHKFGNQSYKNIFEAFTADVCSHYKTINGIVEFFISEAKQIQNGEATEYFLSKEDLNIYWPHDEYIFIKLSKENKIDSFYKEASKLLESLLSVKDDQTKELLNESVRLNKCLLKQPYIKENIKIKMKSNIYDFYKDYLQGNDCTLQNNKNFFYNIDRTSNVWSDWTTWAQEVVWYGNKKGSYLYPIISVD